MKTLATFLLLFIIFGTTATTNAQTLTTAEAVLNAYYNAIGGKEALLKIKDLSWKGISGNGGVNYPTTAKFKSPLKLITTANTPQGQLVYKYVCDGKDAEMTVGGNKISLSRAEMDRYMLTLQLIPELYLADKGVKTTFAGTETVEGKEAYKLTHTMPSGGTWSTYYDTQTGLKVKIYVPGQLIAEVNLYKDYRDVNGIKLPFMLYPGTGNLRIESYQFNTGISDNDFLLP